MFCIQCFWREKKSSGAIILPYKVGNVVALYGTPHTRLVSRDLRFCAAAFLGANKRLLSELVQLVDIVVNRKAFKESHTQKPLFWYNGRIITSFISVVLQANACIIVGQLIKQSSCSFERPMWPRFLLLPFWSFCVMQMQMKLIHNGISI